MIKKKLAKKMRQNRPIPHWIRMRTDNTIRSKSFSIWQIHVCLDLVYESCSLTCHLLISDKIATCVDLLLVFLPGNSSLGYGLWACLVETCYTFLQLFLKVKNMLCSLNIIIAPSSGLKKKNKLFVS